MTPSRLTNDQRKAIVATAVASFFKVREDKFQASKVALADAVYRNAITPAEEKRALAMPRRWYHMVAHISVDCRGFYYRGETDRERISDGWEQVANTLKLSTERPCPAIWGTELRIDKNHPLFTVAQSIVDERKAILAEKGSLGVSIRAIVNSVTTLKKLKEIWPQGAKFFPDEAVAHSTALVPVDTITAVNKLLGLK